MGDGHHGWTAADFLSFVRNLLVRETPDGSIALMTILPTEWRGQPVKVQAAPTHSGRISFELSWVDGKALLAWECEREGVRLLAPGLDPDWTSMDRAGQAFFAWPGDKS